MTIAINTSRLLRQDYEMFFSTVVKEFVSKMKVKLFPLDFSSRFILLLLLLWMLLQLYFRKKWDGYVIGE